LLFGKYFFQWISDAGYGTNPSRKAWFFYFSQTANLLKFYFLKRIYIEILIFKRKPFEILLPKWQIHLNYSSKKGYTLEN
jgi:hypothetical protein